jgi:hypothetical protein
LQGDIPRIGLFSEYTSSWQERQGERWFSPVDSIA